MPCNYFYFFHWKQQTKQNKTNRQALRSLAGRPDICGEVILTRSHRCATGWLGRHTYAFVMLLPMAKHLAKLGNRVKVTLQRSNSPSTFRQLSLHPSPPKLPFPRKPTNHCFIM